VNERVTTAIGDAAQASSSSLLYSQQTAPVAVAYPNAISWGNCIPRRTTGIFTAQRICNAAHSAVDARRPSQAGILWKQLIGSKWVSTRRLPSTYPNSSISKNKCTSLWNIVPNFELGRFYAFLSRNLVRRKCCQLNLTVAPLSH